jgi:hypothetical protein
VDFRNKLDSLFITNLTSLSLLFFKLFLFPSFSHGTVHFITVKTKKTKNERDFEIFVVHLVL